MGNNVILYNVRTALYKNYFLEDDMRLGTFDCVGEAVSQQVPSSGCEEEEVSYERSFESDFQQSVARWCFL